MNSITRVMFEKCRWIAVVVLLLYVSVAAAQVKPPVRDTVKERQDERYKNLADYSKRRKFTKFIHKLIFRPVRVKEPSNNRRKTKAKSPEMANTLDRYSGKIVRRVIVKTMDPFGYSITDTLHQPSNWVEKFGNGVHLKTKEFTIRKLLLFKKNKPLDTLLVKESERLLRSQRYVRRVVIEPRRVHSSIDSVDIVVRVLDTWSLIPNGSASSSGTDIQITERNFLGLGHEVHNDFNKRFKTGETSNLVRYRVPSILNTYIDGTLQYEIWQSDNSLKSVGFQRQFFSTLTRWAGGIYFEERMVRDSLPDMSDLASNLYGWQNLKSEAQDYWGGYAFKIYEGDSEEDRTTRLVTTARFFNQRYKERPDSVYDPYGYFNNEKLYLASVGLTSRKYVQDKFLFNYDIVEDIPIGKVYESTFGIQDKNDMRRLYLGGRYAFGNLYKWGYFSVNFEAGSYFYKDMTRETAFRLDALYFTNIRTWGSWRFRHFVNPQFVIGDNRIPYIKDQLTLTGPTGIPGFESTELRGTSKLLITLQTQSYAPWNIVGFRINPFANFTMGVIGDRYNHIWESNLYCKFGMGVLIYNDYLIFNSFQLSVAFYPNIPGQGYNVFKNNTIKNNDIALPDFQVSRPAVVLYE